MTTYTSGKRIFFGILAPMLFLPAANLVEGVPGVWQDLDAVAHDSRALASFWVGPRGLHFASRAPEEYRCARC